MRAWRSKSWAAGLLLALLLCSLAAWAQTADPAKDAQPQTVRPPQAETVYHGNVRSKKFHRPGCRYYNCKNCVVRFTSRAQAIQAGYVPCKVCKP
jgi:methylphosphotriester-DNA--protein-cysteine methyltransferase